MRQWEYTNTLATSNVRYLDQLGEQGWELICSFREISGDIYYIYKRPKKLVLTNAAKQAMKGYFGGKIG